MKRHVAIVRYTMFRDATANVQENLVGLHSEIEELMKKKGEGIADQMQEIYVLLLEDQNIFKASAELGKKIKEILESADGKFENVYSGFGATNSSVHMGRTNIKREGAAAASEIGAERSTRNN